MNTIATEDKSLTLGGVYEGTIIRKNGDIEHFTVDNLIVNEGLDEILDVMFGGSGQSTTWYLGVFAGNYTPVASLTAATVASAATESSAYTSATRPVWNEAAAASQVMTNSANKASFVFNATATIYGAFLVSSNVKGGTGGKLFSAARFATAKSVDSGDELLLTYALTAASA